MKKFLIGSLGFVALLLVAVLIIPGLLNWNEYKAEISAQVEQATGRKVIIEGDLDLAILPAPRLSAARVSLANIRGGSNQPMVSLRSLAVELRLLPLLGGNIEVDSITLIEPVILLEKLADGRANWEFAPPARNPADKKTAAPAVRLDSLRISQGTILWRDGAGEQRIAGINMEMAAESLSGPFSAKGELIAAGVPLALELAVGRLQPETASPVRLVLSVPSADGKAEFSGSLAALTEKPRLTGKLRTSGDNFRKLLAAVTGGSRTTLPEALAQPFLLNASVKGTPESGELSDLDIELGGIRAAGAVSYVQGPKTRADARIQITRIDLDKFLKEGKPGSSAAAPAKPAAMASQTPFSLPDIDMALALGIDAVTYNKQNLRAIQLRARLQNRLLILDRLSVQLPGGGDAQATGTLRADKGRPAYGAKLDAQSDNLRSLAAWAGMPIDGIPAGRLRKASVSGQISGNDETIQLAGGKISFDSTRADLAATIALRERLAFGATISLDSIDLDAYVPQSASPKSPTGKDAKASDGNALAVLNDFDANLRLRVGNLITNKTRVSGLGFDGTLASGKLTIKNASVENVAGAGVALSGTLSNFSGFPVFNGSVAANSSDIGQTLRAFGVQPDAATRSLGAMQLRGTATGDANQVALDVGLNAAGGKASVKGSLKNLNANPVADARITLNHPELVRLLALAGTEVKVQKLGAVSADLSVAGGLDRLTTSLTVNGAGGRIAANGSVADLMAKPGFDLSVTATHPAVGTLVQSFLPDYRPSGGAIGPLRLDAKLTGANESFSVKTLSISAGTAKLTGNGTLTTEGARPELTARLDGNLLDLNPFLPAGLGVQDKSATQSGRGGGTVRSGQSGASPRPVSASERFPRTPYDAGVLGVMDANLTILATGLIYRQFKVDNPKIDATLKNQVLTIKQIAGRMFDGAFNLSGGLDGRKTPALNVAMDVKGANVGKALFQAAEFDLQGGITDFSMNVTGEGSSPHFMIRSLNGQGKIASRDGSVKGFNLRAVSDRLKNLNRAVDFLSLFGATMEGGETRFSRLDGTFAIRKGVLTTNDLRLIADGGEGRVTGSATLPEWTMDFLGQFYLTDHPKAPPFGMQVVGPIDNPRRIFRFEQLQAFLLQRGVGTILKKLFPGQQGSGSSGQQQPSQPEKKPGLDELLPGLFKQLGR